MIFCLKNLVNGFGLHRDNCDESLTWVTNAHIEEKHYLFVDKLWLEN